MAPRTRSIAGMPAHPIGLGCMPLSDRHMVPERPRALATVHAALDSGVTLLDTADVYAPDGAQLGHNEVLLGEAVRSWAGGDPAGAGLVLATKGGITRTPGPDGDVWGRAASPEALTAAARASADRLGVEVIDLYYLHRLDPSIPFADQVGALAGVREAGIAAHIGLSNVTLVQLDRALELVGGPESDGGIVAVQNEYSARYRVGSDVLDRCAELGIAFLPWSPLGGVAHAGELGSRYAPFAQIAAARGLAPQQVALAWLLSLSPQLIPIPGSTRPATARSSAAAAEIELDADEVARLSATVPDGVSVFPDDVPAPPM